MTAEEVRERLDMPAPDDEEIAESYQSPAQAEAPEDEGGFGGGGGLFREARSLQSVPDNAVSISDRSEAPEGASVIEGPSGGLYYVPGGGEDSEQTGDVLDAVANDLPDEYDGSKEQLSQVSGVVKEAAQDGASYTDLVTTVEGSVDGLDAEASREVRQQAYINRTQELEIGGETVPASPIAREALARDNTELKQAALDQLDDSYIQEQSFGPDQHGSQAEFNAWREERDGSLLNDSTAELWGAAVDTLGNDNVPGNATAEPDTVGDPLPAAVGDDPVTAIGDSVRVTRDTLRDMFGESVPVARGVSGEFAEEIRQARENGEEIELDHRALESWSTFPDHAEEFATEGDDDGVLITEEIPVDEVWGSSFTTPGLEESENELIVGNDGPKTYSPDQIHDPDDEGIAGVYDVAAERGT